MPDERPNIILIMPDQMRGDCLSCDDHPAVLTPNVDQLAAQGTRFSRGYSTIPSCIPARRCLLTGQFPATSGVVGFGGGPIDVPTLPGMLRDHGYQTHMVGRYMHQTPASCRYGFDSQTLGSSHVVGDLFDQFVRHETDHVDGFFSHGLSFNGWTARAWHMDEAMHPTNWVVNESLRFLQHRDETCPFFLTMSFYAPHPPLCPPQFFMDRYLRMNLPEPAIGDWEDPVPPGNTRIVDAARVNLTGEQLRNCQAGYFGLIEHIDNQINRLLSFRGPGGYNSRNTIIIFSSDHGEMLGDHYLFRKCEPFEGSARVPFVIAGGGDLGFRSGQVVDSPVCLEDLMPTCLDLAGVDVPDTVDGESLVPVLRGETDAPRRAYLHGEHAPR